jgi:uncharacterized delta-60 repeat protein
MIGKAERIMTLTRKILSIALATLFSAFSVLAASGDVDATFNASAYNVQGGTATVLAVQPDGKILIGGNFTVVNGFARHGIARLNTDGTIDTSFIPPDLYDPTNNLLGSTVNSIALQSSGKILVAGRFKVQNSTYKTLIRLNTDGSIDTTFNNLSSEFSDGEIIVKVVVRPSGSIFIGGNIGVTNGSVASNTVVKLDSNGVFDAGFVFVPFGGFLKDFAVQPDERILVCDQNIGRYNSDGSIDNSFVIAATNTIVRRLLVQPDGKILVGGDFNNVNGFLQSRIARLNPDGGVDVNFNTNGVGANTNSSVNDIGLASDGTIFIGGTFSTFNGVTRSKIAKLNADGTLDTAFTYTPPSVNTVINDLEVLGNGKILAAGTLTGAANDAVSQLNADGSNDAGFSTKVGKSARVRKILQQADGKVLVAGEFPIINGVARNSLARLNADGSLDTGFVPFFNASAAQTINALAVQSDGRILVGALGGITIKRLNTDGTQDLSFAASPFFGGSIIHDIVVLPSGQILVSGRDITDSVFSFQRDIVRLNSNGTIDYGFNLTDPNNTVYKIYAQADGKILIGGDFTQVGTTGRGRIARLNEDGSLDATFNPPGGANSSVFDIDVQPNGQIVLVGFFTALNGSNSNQRVGRLFPNGSLDANFVQAADGILYAVKIQPDGKILIGGVTSVVGSVPHFCLARLHTNGAVDATFNPFVNQGVWDVNLQTDNKILIGGEFTEVNNISRVSVARLVNTTALQPPTFDYDGDGKSDVSVFRPSTNRWYVYRSSNATVFEATFGLAGDVVSPADYDGDGKTDLGIFRPGSGDWWYLSSFDGGQKSIHWGSTGDIPIPRDFDGDGKADFIIFRPSTNVWYRFGSTGATSITPFGLAGDKPVSGDFDGDGRGDPAIFRPSTGDWWYQSSINGAQLAVRWGISTDIPAPADYDGDGRTDFAVYRPSTGVWYVINSSTGSFLIMAFGIAEDKPVPADYDGDGKADIAVFRPSTGTWYQMKTTAGFSAQQFGVSTDIPTPNAFVP